MVKYTVDAVMALLAHISPIPGPTFSMIWDLANRLYEALCKIDSPDYPNIGHAGYMMPADYFRLFSSNSWNDPAKIDNCFILPPTLIAETDQKSAMNRWGAVHTKRENFRNVSTALKTFFEWVINEAYHSSTTNTSIGLRGFGNDEPPAILSCLQLMYGRPSDSKTERLLLHLHEPMDCTLPIEVMLHQIEDV
jgi:hypothetical protein